MIETADQLAFLLEGTLLQGREIVGINMPGSGTSHGSNPESSPSPILAVRIDGGEVWPAWQVGRSLLDQTGRWPVATCSWEPGSSPSSSLETFAEVLDRIEYKWELAGPTDPDSIVDRSLNVDLEARLSELAHRTEGLDEPGPDGSVEPVSGYLDWFEPRDQPVALLFLPDPIPEHTLGYVHWYAANNEVPSHVLVALLRQWRQAFGADLVAHWGTMLEFTVGHRPDSLEQARALAVQQVLVAPCTTELPGVTIDQHAATLRTSDRWFLHERP